jgi:hypothetical protein
MSEELAEGFYFKDGEYCNIDGKDYFINSKLIKVTITRFEIVRGLKNTNTD